MYKFIATIILVFLFSISASAQQVTALKVKYYGYVLGCPAAGSYKYNQTYLLSWRARLEMGKCYYVSGDIQKIPTPSLMPCVKQKGHPFGLTKILIARNVTPAPTNEQCPD